MAPADNTEALLRARRAESEKKRNAVLEAVSNLLDNGIAVSFAAVARQAKVSEGLVHTPDLKKAIREAIEFQRIHGAVPTAPGTRIRSTVTAPSLKTDLGLARAEIAALRDKNAELLKRVQRALGAELESMEQHDALTRIDFLEQQNRALLADADELRSRFHEVSQAREELQEEITSLRAAYAKLIRRVNAVPPAS